jgi:Holliday junction resolvasome RuvABC endonuclease subunit
MRNNRKPTVLALDPGTRQMGVAVLDGRRLVYHGVKTLPWHPSPHMRLDEGRRIVLRLLRDFRPQVLVVEKAFFANSRNTALLNVFVDEIRSLGRRRGIAMRALAPSTVKKRACGDGRATKRDVARAVVARYPELNVYLGQDREWKERYHGNMFDAVAIAMAADRDTTTTL